MNRIIRISLCLWSFLLLAQGAAFSQQYNRIHADFSVKVKTASGGQSLTMGQVYYDRNIKQIIYYVSFPEKEMWITSDTMVYQVRNDKLISKTSTFSIAEFTVFHLALNSRLQDYGLRNTTYKVENVDREKDLVITTWAPPEKARESLGNILVSVKSKQLFGVVFQDPKGIPLRKQFFEEYQVVSGLSFPGKIVEVNTTAGIDSYQVTTYKNVVVDEMDNDNKYYYPVGALR